MKLLTLVYNNGFQPGSRDPQRGREPFLEGASWLFYVRSCITFALFAKTTDLKLLSVLSKHLA